MPRHHAEGDPAGPCPACGHQRIYSYAYKHRHASVICLQCEPGGLAARVNPNLARQYKNEEAPP